MAIAGIILLLLGNIGDGAGIVLTSNTFGMLDFSGYYEIFIAVLLVATLFYFMLSGKDIEAVGHSSFDFYALIFFVITGICLCASYSNLLMLFLGIEVLSIPLYILTGADKKNLKSNEASLKYFLMGSFSTGILLLGIALIYGESGSFLLKPPPLPFAFEGMAVTVNCLQALRGVLLVMFALAFKVSAAPFHFWTPDVYDGAPTPFTSFMATIVKAGGFIAFFRLMAEGYGEGTLSWGLAMSVLIGLTLLVGNLTAVFQMSVKRMMAYSSIAQAGFMLIAVYTPNEHGHDGLLIYTASYCLATIGIFAVLGKLKDPSLEGFNGLAKKEPFTANCRRHLPAVPGRYTPDGGFLGTLYAQRYWWMSDLSLLGSPYSPSCVPPSAHIIISASSRPCISRTEPPSWWPPWERAGRWPCWD